MATSEYLRKERQKRFINKYAMDNFELDSEKGVQRVMTVDNLLWPETAVG